MYLGAIDTHMKLYPPQGQNTTFIKDVIHTNDLCLLMIDFSSGVVNKISNYEVYLKAKFMCHHINDRFMGDA